MQSQAMPSQQAPAYGGYGMPLGYGIAPGYGQPPAATGYG